jgi:hypothetical protein
MVETAELIKQYQTKVTAFLRAQDLKRAQGDENQVRLIQSMTDQDVLRRWMWVISVIGGPVCFIVFPLAVEVLTPFLPLAILSSIWVLVKIMMACMLAFFGAAVLFTVNQTNA